MLGIDPELIVPNDQVALIRKQRAEMMAQQQAAAQAQQQAATAKDLAAARTDQPSALTEATGMFSGYN
jgi:hypothetical protein